MIRVGEMWMKIMLQAWLDSLLQVLILSAISIHPVRTVTERHEVRRFFCSFLSYFFQFPALTRLIPPILLVIFLENKYCRLSTSGFKAFSGPCVLGEYSCTRFLTIMESARYAACNEDEQARPLGRSWIYRWHPNLHQTLKRCWNSPRNDHLYSAKSIVLDNMYIIYINWINYTIHIIYWINSGVLSSNSHILKVLWSIWAN